MERVRRVLESPLGRGLSGQGWISAPFSEGVGSEVLSPGRLQTQAYIAMCWTACNLGRLSSKTPFSFVVELDQSVGL